MSRRLIYLVIFIMSFILGLWIKLQRHDLFGMHSGLDIFLSSGPSFFYVTGLVSGYVTFANTVQSKKLTGRIIGLSCGALLWEVHQYFLSAMYFDWNDVAATLLALLFLLLLQHYKPVDTPLRPAEKQ